MGTALGDLLYSLLLGIALYFLIAHSAGAYRALCGEPCIWLRIWVVARHSTGSTSGARSTSERRSTAARLLGQNWREQSERFATRQLMVAFDKVQCEAVVANCFLFDCLWPQLGLVRLTTEDEQCSQLSAECARNVFLVLRSMLVPKELFTLTVYQVIVRICFQQFTWEA